MGAESEPNQPSHLPEWKDCEFFCIHNYAAVARRCGWRGCLPDARGNVVAKPVCPRCGGATLLSIAANRAPGSLPPKPQ
jgi:hypothetical protein